MILPNGTDIEIYFNGEKYVGEAAFINWYNGYESTFDDWLLCAIIDKSCWQKISWDSVNRIPNTLTDSEWIKIQIQDCRGLEIFIN